MVALALILLSGFISGVRGTFAGGIEPILVEIAASQTAKSTSDCTRSGVPTSPCRRRSARDRTVLTEFLAVVGRS